MLPALKNQLATPIRTMPDLLDRTRIAAIAVLAAFAALALTFVTHLATTGVSLQVPGLPGEGLVLLAPDGASPSGGTQAGSGAVSGSATSPLAPGGFASGGEAGSRAGQNAGPEAGAPNTGSGPRQVGISIGSASPGQPGATPAPGATPTPVTGFPGTGTSGTGGSPEDTAGDGTTVQPGPANNWGHGPVAPTSSGRGSTAGSSTATTSSSGVSAAAGAGTSAGSTKPSSSAKPVSGAPLKPAPAVKPSYPVKTGPAAPVVKSFSAKGPSTVVAGSTSSSSLGAKVKSVLPGQQR